MLSSNSFAAQTEEMKIKLVPNQTHNYLTERIKIITIMFKHSLEQYVKMLDY